MTEKIYSIPLNATICDIDSGTTKISMIETHYPSNETTMRQQYHEGINSIVKQLPQPNVKMFHDHSYVSIHQCLADFLGKGGYPLEISKTHVRVQRNIVDSKISKIIYERAIVRNPNVQISDLIIILGVQWSDDFEPNT